MSWERGIRSVCQAHSASINCRDEVSIQLNLHPLPPSPTARTATPIPVPTRVVYCHDSLRRQNLICNRYCTTHTHTHTHTQKRFIFSVLYSVDTKKTGTFEKPNKVEEIQEKKILKEIEPLQLAF